MLHLTTNNLPTRVGLNYRNCGKIFNLHSLQAKTKVTPTSVIELWYAGAACACTFSEDAFQTIVSTFAEVYESVARPPGIVDQTFDRQGPLVYQDPVRLPCLHSFCLKCIEGAWAQTPGSGKFVCPQCRQIFNRKPNLERKATEGISLIKFLEDAENILQGLPQVATYPDGISISGSNNKEHFEKLDIGLRAVIDEQESDVGVHVDQMLVKLEKEFEKIDDIQRNCSSKKEELERSEAEIKTQISEIKEKLSKNFSEWRRKLNEDEEFTMRVIDEEGLQALSQIQSCSEALNHKMEQIALIDEEIKSFLQKDPLSIIQNSTQLISRVKETKRITEPDVPVVIINLSNISQQLQKKLKGWEMYHADILGAIRNSPLNLDLKTANFNLILSNNLRSVTWTGQEQPYPPHPQRFKDCPQVLCSQSFSSGSHSWDVQIDGNEWGVGIAYESLDREGKSSYLGKNSKSWSLDCGYIIPDYLWARHNSQFTLLPSIQFNPRIRVQLDYEAGTLSFHQVTDSLTHLHTFQTTFTEPLFPAFYCYWNTSIKLLI
ncbi:E3 ubiquitin/ISG15 ligase TRIM25-like [Hemiscyllium ocellatum]|uniref:E3 ubiquitin/ISG15 ligase TRIM25-like n=1 Tax=Hemiscyllium ocellatum TaxID=170820 RepID=UPI002965EFBC|nr:E3 ubiquitin/ISG15 ligase TRIM25-like [Hemiscyllium ocellatum]